MLSLRLEVRVLLLLLIFKNNAAHYSSGRSGPVRGTNGQPEDERIAAYHANGHSWPCIPHKGWPNPTPTTRSAEAERNLAAKEKRIRDLSDGGMRWNRWTQLVQSCIMPQFTPSGFAVIDAPAALFRDAAALYAERLAPGGVEGLPYEPDMSSRAGGRRGGDFDVHSPRWIEQSAINARMHREMKPLLEEWSGTELAMGQVYGLRVYTNGSTLVNHIDRTETHVISFIFHIGHDLDEPWPLEIEDHDGTVHAIALQPGKVILYESSKMMHARMTPMRGRHYASVFGHYMPAIRWNWTKFDITTAVPPGFQYASSAVSRLAHAPTETRMNAYVREYWHGRGMAVPVYPHEGDDARPIHTFSSEL